MQLLPSLPDDGNNDNFKPCGLVSLQNKKGALFVQESRVVASFENSVLGSYSVASPLIEEVKKEKQKSSKAKPESD